MWSRYFLPICEILYQNLGTFDAILNNFLFSLVSHNGLPLTVELLNHYKSLDSCFAPVKDRSRGKKITHPRIEERTYTWRGDRVTFEPTSWYTIIHISESIH